MLPYGDRTGPPAPDADPAVAVERAEWDDDVSERVAHAMKQLDERSRAILRTMKADEARHADQALAAGARLLPQPVPRLMALSSRVMKALAYRA